ncbi:hypothetical protein WDZ11_00925 [Roseomonas mucosa]|jgi:hypothetical protein|uniref:hypothetical protein n=1 Tax=Roseomonas mucosa TaxID=207340 RepID=UPI0028CF7E4A|nr:hypothetical protein [Roseomonas sp. DSM 102946]
MSVAAFDFQTLAARAVAENPDAHLLALIERYTDHRRLMNRGNFRTTGGAYAAACATLRTLEHEIARTRPQTREGAVAKVRLALGRRAKIAGQPCLYDNAIRDALRFMGERVADRRPKGRRA